jgi:hypothetical protein
LAVSCLVAIVHRSARADFFMEPLAPRRTVVGASFLVKSFLGTAPQNLTSIEILSMVAPGASANDRSECAEQELLRSRPHPSLRSTMRGRGSAAEMIWRDVFAYLPMAGTKYSIIHRPAGPSRWSARQATHITSCATLKSNPTGRMTFSRPCATSFWTR